ncbi:MAG TPA: sigma-70 family RNA polymerase sigma factor [Propionibacteriaceae bacterium]|nr:sigma-70 family RNA polymerase sigma factor [Propionibacteriaceae bacterium]
MTETAATEDLLRRLAPQVLGTLVRRYGQFAIAEDATQEALLQADQDWRRSGVPENPRAWLITVASRRMTDLVRAEQARRRREETAARTYPMEESVPGADVPSADEDDSLVLLFLCCHPSLAPAAQIALTLRAVGGLTTAEIARAFLVSEATMTRRITRAKQAVRDSGARFRLPTGDAYRERLGVVLHVLYLIFNEGYATTAGENLQRSDLTAEAIRLTRMVHGMRPDDDEVTGLLALMLLTDARRPARTDEHGDLVPMAEQDRSRWDAAAIREGVGLLTAAVAHHNPGPYQIQAAIAALHDEAPAAEATDWVQIRALYEALLRVSDNPVVALNHVVAVAMSEGAEAGRTRLTALAADPRIAEHPRFHAVYAHLLEMAGDEGAAREAYAEAARRSTSIPQQRYLHGRAARLAWNAEAPGSSGR